MAPFFIGGTAVEIAALGLKADSTGVVMASKDLRDLAQAAADAERAAVSLAAAETKKARATLASARANKESTSEQIKAAQAA